jgi:hypothetical protein
LQNFKSQNLWEIFEVQELDKLLNAMLNAAGSDIRTPRVINRTSAASLRAKMAETIVLDFVQPASPAWRRFGRRRQTRLDNSQPGAAALTQRH